MHNGADTGNDLVRARIGQRVEPDAVASDDEPNDLGCREARTELAVGRIQFARDPPQHLTHHELPQHASGELVTERRPKQRQHGIARRPRIQLRHDGPHDRRPDRVTRTAQDLGHQEVRPDGNIHCCGEQVSLVRKVVMHQGRIDSGQAGNSAQRRRVVASIRKLGPCRLDNLRSGIRAIRADTATTTTNSGRRLPLEIGCRVVHSESLGRCRPTAEILTSDRRPLHREDDPHSPIVLGMGYVILGIIVLLIIIIGIYLWATYNSLITLKNRVDEAWSDITVQLKRRADLIPNLVSSVQGYAAHESGVFEAVTAARAATISAATPAQAGAAENQMQTALKSIFAVAEAYPQLQASQNFLELQAQLVDTEDKIQASRRFYNGGVRDFNTKIQTFPNNAFAKRLGFSARDFFEVDDPTAIAEPPRVQF